MTKNPLSGPRKQFKLGRDIYTASGKVWEREKIQPHKIVSWISTTSNPPFFDSTQQNNSAKKSSEAAADLITLVNVDDSLGRVTDYEDQHHPGQQGYHGLVPPVGEEDGEGDY